MALFTKLLNQFRTFAHVPSYFRAIAKEWMNILFGETLVGVIFLIWWALGSPPLVLIFLSAALVAGFYAWQPLYVRSIPKLAISEFSITPTPTDVEPAVVIHVIPECLTDVPVNECKDHLLQVFKKSDDQKDWQPTAIDEPSDLTWSIHDDANPRTLYPGVLTRLNLCVINQVGGIQLMGNRLLRRWGSVFNEKDVFRFDIRVTAKDCAPVNASVTVRMRGQWDAPDVAILKPQTAGVA